MATEEQKGTINIAAPTQPKIGGAIASFGGWGAVGTTGAASMSLPLPISNAPNRDLAPALSLGYSSHVGNSIFGMGWHLTVNAITLRTSKGVPLYEKNKDLVVGPEGETWMPELDADGEIVTRPVTLGTTTYQSIVYQPRTEGGFSKNLRLFSDDDPAGFWLIHSADGSRHVYGKTLASRRAEPRDDDKPLEPYRTGVWLHDETVTVRGEHFVSEYKAETEAPLPPDFQDFRAQRFLHRVLYGNAVAEPELYSLKDGGWEGVHFLFHLLFDYGERSHDLTQTPAYGPPHSKPGDQYGEWLKRDDVSWNHDYGFSLGTQRLCRQVLMFHHFPDELGDAPQLVQRLLLDYHPTSLGYNQLTAAHLQAYDRQGAVESRPPMEFNYAPFDFDKGHQPGWKEFPQMPGLNDGQRYQLVDLYGKGLPGILCRYDKAWYYRDVHRADSLGDDIRYGELKELPYIPVANSTASIRQTLSDLNGDGKLEWGLHAPAMNGFFTMNPDQQWSTFVPYKAFPLEYFHPQSQMADLVGDGRTHIAMIGSNSVRLYTNLGDEQGFSAGRDVLHDQSDALPLISSSETEVVGFGDFRGSGKQDLFRLRCDSLELWPNLGHGRFGKRIVLDSPTFKYGEFQSARVVLADTDGSGAVDLIYLESDHMRVFMNRCGRGFASLSVDVPWPEGVRYDRLCQVTTADLQGLGCTSVVLTKPHMSPQHWRYDFVHAKPYLINRSNNNMGALSRIDYRSSAQEFLDEEHEQHKIDKDKIVESGVPFAMHLVKRQTQIDEITGNKLTQLMSYRGGYYDPFEREFRGFRLLLQRDTEATDAERATLGFTAPILSKTWFHIGKQIEQPRTGYYQDAEALALKPTRLERFHARDNAAEPLEPDEATAREIARALSGSTLRTEVFAADDPAVPYAVTEHRAQVRLLRSKGEHYPYSVLQVMGLESISYQYEPALPDDPRCEHSVSVEWDEYGAPLHAFTVYYARRRTDETPPFEDEHENRYWTDAHDPAQQCWYLTQAKAEFIHVYDEASWKPGMPYRLGLPYRERANALVLDKALLNAEDICHENFVEWSQDDGDWAKQSVLAGMSEQYYIDPATGLTMDSGKATVHALPGHVVIAELDAPALSAYDKLKDENGNMPFSLKDKLESPEVGYKRMARFLPPESSPPDPTDPDAKKFLWAVHRGFPHYLGPDAFYNVDSFQQTKSHGITKVVYDDYWCLHTSIELPDGCTTTIKDVDYCTFLPAAIEDPNRNTQEARYSAFGEVLVTSFYGTELGEKVGFDPLNDYARPDDRSPATAIEAPFDAIGNYAMAMFSDAFSWMGSLPTTEPPTAAWLAWARAEGFVLPGGHLCDRARQHLQNLDEPTANERLLQQYVEDAHREPVHVATLQADRYPGDEELQIRIAILHQDGFGRVLQTKQEVEPGKAWVVNEDGSLKLKEDGTPEEAEAARRWRVSEPVEYNNKGEKVRIYRPYFADKFHRINDDSLRQFQFHDKQFYDPVGRPTHTILAKKMAQGPASELKPLRREQQYRTWYTIALDENDLFDPPPPEKKRGLWTLH